MEKRNIIELQTGVNKIEITSEDFNGSGKIPIAILPANTQILNVYFNVDIPLKSNPLPNQSNSNSAIINRLLLGNINDSQLILTYNSLGSIGSYTPNTGSYFDTSPTHTTSTKIILENWLLPRVWSIGGDMIIPKFSFAASGTSEAALNFGGWSSMTGTTTDDSEEYNGTTWSTIDNLYWARYGVSGFGSVGATLAFGGMTSYNTTAEYTGVTWTLENNLNQGRGYSGSCGTYHAGLCFGGRSGSIIYRDETELWDSITWITGDDLLVAKGKTAGCGTQTSALNFGGLNDTSADLSTTEEYNGTWSIGNDLNVGKHATSGCGTQNNALNVSGFVEDTTEEYDGITWTIGNNINIYRAYTASCGTQHSAINMGGRGTIGNNGSSIITTESYAAAESNQISMDGKLTLNLTIN